MYNPGAAFLPEKKVDASACTQYLLELDPGPGPGKWSRLQKRCGRSSESARNRMHDVILYPFPKWIWYIYSYLWCVCPSLACIRNVEIFHKLDADLPFWQREFESENTRHCKFHCNKISKSSKTRIGFGIKHERLVRRLWVRYLGLELDQNLFRLQ